jgi:hypothetical protein
MRGCLSAKAVVDSMRDKLIIIKIPMSFFIRAYLLDSMQGFCPYL